MSLNISIEQFTDFGNTVICLKDLMNKKGITIYQLSRLSNIKYETIKKYYNGICFRFDDVTLSKICYILNCEIKDIIKYVPPKSNK